MQPHELDLLCDKLMELQVRRKFAISLANKQINAAKALVRRALGWRFDADDDGREATNKRAGRIVDAFLTGKAPKPEDAEPLGMFAEDLAAVREALAPCEKRRNEIEREMVRAARRLPVHPWQAEIAGFGEKALAIIIGETGNLSRYDHEDKLKKRLGLAPFSGKAYSRWRVEGGLSADDWINAGYAPRRRAEIHTVMEPLFRHQTMRQGRYRLIYDKRRGRTAETHPEWKPIQSHMDGLRIMTQELITDLWSVWRGAISGALETAKIDMPAATGLADEAAAGASEQVPDGQSRDAPAESFAA